MAVSLSVPMFTAKFGEGASDTVRFMNRTEKQGFNTVDRLMSRSKGVGDVLGLVSKSFRFASLAYPESNVTAHISSVTGHARTAMALPYTLSVINKCVESFKDKKFFTGTRNALELGSTASFASSMLIPDKVLASTFGGVGSAFKTVVDGMDLGTNVDKFVHLNDIRSKAAADPACSAEVKDGINSQFTATILKVGRFALALFAGVLTVLTFVFKVAVAKELLIAGMVASIGSIIFSLASELVTESADVVPVPSDWRRFEKLESPATADGHITTAVHLGTLPPANLTTGVRA